MLMEPDHAAAMGPPRLDLAQGGVATALTQLPPMADLYGSDAYAPREVATRVADVGVAKARLKTLPLLALAVLAGAFIGFGALLFALVLADTTLPWAAQRLLGGLVFSLGLVLVSVAGAELFTGNNLLAMAWAARRIGSAEVLRNWALACAGNAVGAAGLALLVALSGRATLGGGSLQRGVLGIAEAKAQLPLLQAFFSGMLCNVLVCMAVWMAMAGRSVADKVLAIVFPVTAFVALGFEHSIANLFYFPLAALWGAALPAADVLLRLVVVIAGNIAGGSVLVALVYWVIYLREPADGMPTSPPAGSGRHRVRGQG
jgi:formate transporter